MAHKTITIPWTDNLEYKIPIPEKKEDVFGWDLPKKQQKWRRLTVPNFSLMNEDEKDKYFERELVRKVTGVHFMNNGNVEYITGNHYWFLQHWNLGGGKYPRFFNWHKHLAYLLDLCRKDPDCFGAQVLASKRGGKALDIDTPIPTPDGWKTMGEIRIGDYVFGEDGLPTKVVADSGVQHDRNCYEIQFFDGSKIVADEDHRWLVSNYRDRAKTTSGHKLNKRVVTTKDLLANLKSGQNNNNWTIENCLPAKYSNKDLKIPAYIMGLWLGDGSSYYTKLTNIDEEIINEWSSYGKSIGLRTVKDGKVTYMLTSGNRGTQSNINPLLNNLRGYNLISNKHIPKDYLQSSVQDRIDLLNGLMDTDGCKYKDSGTYEFCTKLPALRDDFYELISSLGFKGRISKKTNKKVNKTYYYVRFGGTHINPFRLKRKADQVKLIKGGIRPNYRYISAINKVESRPVKCIQVDNNNHTYLCGKDFIVTHNSEFVPCEFLSDAMLQDVAGYIIQAQNDTKSKKLFRRTLRAFQAQKRSLPYTYQHFTTQNEILFKNALANKKTSKKISKDDIAESDHVSIGAYPSKIDFIQGETTRGIFMDEYCSQEQMDMEEWMDTAIAQCSEGIGKTIVGKIWLIATPERAKSKSLPFAEKLYENSDPSQRNENNRTISGLYRMLVPYYESTPDFLDEYGYSDVEAAKKFFANMCAGKSADKVRELKRKYISCKEDAFDIDFGGGIEADVAEILKNRLEVLKRENPPVYRAVLYEENGTIMFKPTLIPEKDIEMEDEAVRIFEPPKKGCLYRIGVDGTATDKETSATQDSKKSKYSVTVTKLFDPDPHASSYCDVAEFVARPGKMDECYRITAYLTRLYNIDNKCRVLPEGNAGNAAPIVGFFRNKSLLQLMLKQPKYAGTDSAEVFDRYCFYRDGNVRKTQLDLLNVAGRMYGHGWNSRRLILDILRMGKFNTDLADSFQASILAWGGFSEPPKPKKEPDKQKIMQFNREEGIFEEVEI